MIAHTKRIILFVCGWLFVILGIVGVLLPLVPTTPFLLLAAFCFSRSSERFHNMLLNHRIFGPSIRDWNDHGVIKLHIKWLSSVLMITMVTYPLLFMIKNNWVRASVALAIICVLIFIWTRPSAQAK
ncbi:YbaN family protein [Ningiella sp. W23]|uniref:YbaN family protein n=1 Tax=Ningiella sp. W23 TaxID=3023715 RepID=UPI00375695E0